MSLCKYFFIVDNNIQQYKMLMMFVTNNAVKLKLFEVINLVSSIHNFVSKILDSSITWHIWIINLSPLAKFHRNSWWDYLLKFFFVLINNYREYSYNYFYILRTLFWRKLASLYVGDINLHRVWSKYEINNCLKLCHRQKPSKNNINNVLLISLFYDR